MIIKNYTPTYNSDPGFLVLGFFIRDSNGKLIQNLDLVENIKITSPSGTVWNIPARSPFQVSLQNGYYKGGGYTKHGQDKYYSYCKIIEWSYMWYYYDSSFQNGEEGNYTFEATVQGKTISTKVYFQKFMIEGNPLDPLGTETPTFISYDKTKRELVWNKVSNAEGYRVFIIEGNIEDYSKMIYNSNGIKISNIWDSNPQNNSQISFKIPDEVLIENGKTYYFRIDSYVFTKTIFVQDSNYFHDFRQIYTIN